MAVVIGVAGESAQRRAIYQAFFFPAGTLLASIGAVGFGVMVFGLTSNPLLLVLSSFAWLLIIALISGRDWLYALELFVESKHWARGAAGEREASRELGNLPDDFLILNDVHPGFRGLRVSWNWDHVIIGPTGIFVVDSKNYSDRRIRDGGYDARTQRNVQRVRSFAIEFKKELVRLNPDLSGVFVVPVLAYVNVGAWVENLRERDVEVLPKRLLRKNIARRPRGKLDAGEAIKIAHLLFKMYPQDVQVHDQEAFASWARRVRRSDWSAPQDVEAAARQSDPLSCPSCGAPMKRRDGPYGAFLGCSRYFQAGCKGKRALDGTPK
ncbi:MAG: hypothetical protein Kow0056_15880 [Coriobacteriia bacterium]